MLDEIGALEDGQAGEIGKGRIDQIISVARARDAGIGIEAGEDRVAIIVRRLRDAGRKRVVAGILDPRSEEDTYELQALMRISYTGFCLNNKNITTTNSVRGY